MLSYLLAAAGLLLLATHAPPTTSGALIAAPGPGLHRLVLDPDSSLVWAEGDATLGHFRAEDRLLGGWATYDGDAPGAGARGSVLIEVAGFRTGLAVRDGHLRSALDARRFPRIEFALSRVEPIAGPAPDSVLLVGTLSIHGAAREVSIPTRLRQAGDTVRVSGRLPLLFTDFGLQPPHRLLGTIRVENALVAGFSALFLPADAP